MNYLNVAISISLPDGEYTLAQRYVFAFRSGNKFSDIFTALQAQICKRQSRVRIRVRTDTFSPMTEIINPLANERLACRLRDTSPSILANWGRRWPESCRKLRHRRSISLSRFINRSTETAAPASWDTSRCVPGNGIPLFSFKPYLSVSKIFFRATHSFVLVHKNQSWQWKYRDLRRKAHLV